MEDSVGLTIEKIRQQEVEQQAELKEKRDLETTNANLKRSIRDATLQTDKLIQEEAELLQRTNKLRADLDIESVRRDALTKQLEVCREELEVLKAKVDQGMSEVWNLRSSLCQQVQEVADVCDIWALLTKPVASKPMVAFKKPEETDVKCLYENRIKEAIERRDKALLERERLKTEPENGENFIRAYTNFRNTVRCYSKKIDINPEDVPIKFTTSPANIRGSSQPVLNKAALDMPWYQPYCITMSISVFMIYFCILREENDIDMEFTKTLYDRLDGLEKHQLIQNYMYNKEKGMDTTAIENRLKELEQLETKKMAAQ